MDWYGEQSRFITIMRFSVSFRKRSVICRLTLSERNRESSYT